MQLTGGQALVQSLVREGVETVFGLPGVGKTRLAVEFAGIVREGGGRVILGRSLSYGASAHSRERVVGLVSGSRGATP